MPPRVEPEDSATRRLVGRLIGAAIVAGAIVAVIVTLLQWETRPQTDDATVRANFIGIAPQVSGHIVDLRVRDNQEIREGDLLFVVDPRPYEIAVARARANLALAQKEVAGLRNGLSTADAGVAKASAQLDASAADIIRREADPVASDAEIARLQAQRAASEATLFRANSDLKYAQDYLARVEQLLPEKFITEDKVDDARTKRVSAAMATEQARTSVVAIDAALDEARAKRRAAVAALAATRAQHVATEAAFRASKSDRAKAEDSIGELANTNARIAAAEAAVHSAELDLEFTHVRAPFSGRVVNLNISNGAFARTGVDVFTLVDTGTWYVMANFRETQLRHIPDGAPVDLYLQSQPGRRFRGTVVGLGWAVLPENGTSVNGLPRVERSLDWIRLAARFPVRIEIEDPDDSFRIGASAVATVHGSVTRVSQ